MCQCHARRRQATLELQKLSINGFDTFVGGVGGYSTVAAVILYSFVARSAAALAKAGVVLSNRLALDYLGRCTESTTYCSSFTSSLAIAAATFVATRSNMHNEEKIPRKKCVIHMPRNKLTSKIRPISPN